MITTIAIIFGVIVALAIGVVLLLALLNKRANSKASLVATVDIHPSGESHVEFITTSNIEDIKLMKIALLYAAKIRYVQSEENPQIVGAYERFIEEIVTPSELSESNDFIERLSEIATMVQSQDEVPAATKTGERFTIRLVGGRNTDYVHNDLPFRGLAINVPVSVLLLAYAVAVRLSEPNILIFERAFANLNKAMFDGSKPQLFALNRAALDALNAES